MSVRASSVIKTSSMISIVLSICYSSIENADTIELVKEYMLSMSDADRYLFVAHSRGGKGQVGIKELGILPRFVSLAKEDPKYSVLIRRGDVEIRRTGSDRDIQGKYTDIEYIDENDLGAEYRKLCYGVGKLARGKKGVTKEDLIPAIGAFIMDNLIPMNIA